MTWQRHPYLARFTGKPLYFLLVIAIHIPGIAETTFIRLETEFLGRKPSRIRINPGTRKLYLTPGTLMVC